MNANRKTTKFKRQKKTTKPIQHYQKTIKTNNKHINIIRKPEKSN